MNRKIKFRAYDKVRKEYLLAGRIFLTINSGKNPADSVQYLDVLRDPDLYADRFEIEQFTGRLDRNGKEIYEGDVVRYYDDIEDELKNGVVIYHVDSCSFCVEPTDAEIFGLGAHWQFKVIGNRFDNPDLLNSK